MYFRTLGLILFVFFAINQAFALSIKEAKAKGLISYSIKENPNGTHYHSPLLLKVKNLSNQSIDLELDNGQILNPKDPFEQDFIITNSLYVQLGPKKEQDIELYAMCIEESDGAPRESSEYEIGPMANAALREFSLFIEDNKYFEPDAQFVMWDLAEGEYLAEEIDDFEIDEEGQIWIVDADDKKLEKTIPEIEEEEVAKPKLMVNGSFEMNFSRPKNVHIAMFNTSNVIVKELYKNPNTPIGQTSLNYEFNSYDFEDEEYYVKLVVDGKVLLTRTIDMRF